MKLEKFEAREAAEAAWTLGWRPEPNEIVHDWQRMKVMRVVEVGSFGCRLESLDRVWGYWTYFSALGPASEQ